MATGGTFQTQNKVRPGAYINFLGVPKSLSSVGERGVVAIPLSLSWGDEVVELTANDLITGASLQKVGFTFSDEASLNARLALQSCYKAILYRLNHASATAASGTIGGISCTAKFGGAFGNLIEVSVAIESHEESGETVVDSYTVKTFANNTLVDTQKVAAISSLASNGFVNFTPGGSITAAARTALTGGADGTEPSDFSSAFNALQNYAFNVLAITSTTSTIKAQAVQFVERLRDEQGVKVQVVLDEYNGDSEAVITSQQGYLTSDGGTISKTQAVLTYAGMQAGASITESLTGAVVPDAVAVIGAPQTHDDIIDALNAGKFIISRRQDGAIVVEKDQNSLHTFTPSKGYIFSKNRPIRVLDQVGNDVKALFNKSYLGKLSNDENGRNIFKADIAAYMLELQRIGAIQNFDIDDIMIAQGTEADSIVVQLAVQPVDSMEKLYMTINVYG